jgi:hypothetical protein
MIQGSDILIPGNIASGLRLKFAVLQSCWKNSILFS